MSGTWIGWRPFRSLLNANEVHWFYGWEIDWQRDLGLSGECFDGLMKNLHELYGPVQPAKWCDACSASTLFVGYGCGVSRRMRPANICGLTSTLSTTFPLPACEKNNIITKPRDTSYKTQTAFHHDETATCYQPTVRLLRTRRASYVRYSVWRETRNEKQPPRILESLVILASGRRKTAGFRRIDLSLTAWFRAGSSWNCCPSTG